LVVGKNLTLADIQVEIFDESAFNLKFTDYLVKSLDPLAPHFIIDPNEVYKSRLVEGGLETMVPYGEIPTLCLQAFKLHQRFEAELNLRPNQEESKQPVDIKELELLVK